MNFGRCADCREYKHLVQHGKCQSCASSFPLEQTASTLLLGDIGTGKTIATQIAIHRFLKSGGKREVFLLDTLDQHDALQKAHPEQTLKLSSSSCTMNPLSAVGYISGNHARIIDAICREELQTQLSPTVKQIINQTAQTLGGTCTVEEILTDLQAQHQANATRSNPNGRHIATAISSLAAFGTNGTLAQLSSYRDPRLDNRNSITRVVGGTDVSITQAFAALPSIYKEAMETAAETMIVVDAGYPYFTSEYSEFIVDAFDSLRGNNALWIASQPDTKSIATAGQQAEQRGILAGTRPNNIPFNVPSSHVSHLSKSAGQGYLTVDTGTRWLDAQFTLTNNERRYFC